MGSAGTAGPQGVEGVGQCHIFQSVGGQCGHVSQRHHVGRCAHTGDALCLEPLGHGGRVGIALAHQCKGCAFELCGGLQPIARVGPQCGSATGGDHGQAGRAVKSREPLAALPAHGYVLIIVRVGSGHDVCLYCPTLGPGMACEPLAKGLYTLGYCHGYKLICWVTERVQPCIYSTAAILRMERKRSTNDLLLRSFCMS